MTSAIYDAINNAGAFEGMEESEIAQYVSDTSKLFANQVLAEANKRGCSIDGVLKASDIKFENGKIRLQAGKETIAETPIVQMDVNAEIVNQNNVKMDENGQTKLFQSAMKRSQFNNFNDFYNNVVNNTKLNEKEQFNYLTNNGLNIRIPHDTIIHDAKEKHKLNASDWNDLLNNIDNIVKAEYSKHKSRYDGKPVLLKIKTNNKTYGAVIEIFKKNNPLISTAFYDNENSIDNWIKNEAVSSGTKTSFLNISLNDIITNIYPNFKSKTINNGINKLFQTAEPVNSEAFKKFFKPEQIKSVNNQGTFDSNNPNIYMQLKDLPKQKSVYKGSYNVSEKAIELFKDADYSTLPHEFAHFWLDNMWEFSRSGRASEAYMNNFNSVLDWLGVKDSQTYLTRSQQEKFAKGYEKPQKCTK